VFSGGKELKPAGTPAIVHKGTTLVPIALLRQLGVDVKWDGEKQSVEVTMPEPKPMPVLSTQELEELAKGVYLVRAFNADGKIDIYATGFIVNGMFITAAHVGMGKAYIEAFIDGKWQRLDDVVFSEKVYDLIDMMGYRGVKGGKNLPIETEIPVVGEPVYAVGYHDGKLDFKIGKVTDSRMLGGYYIIRHNAVVEKGFSGGPLFNGSGKVIGLNFAIGDFWEDKVTLASHIMYAVN